MFRSFSDKKSPRKSFRLKPPFTRHAISILICAACMLCATLASFLYQSIVPDNHANVALFYILALVIIARWTVGYGYGIACDTGGSVRKGIIIADLFMDTVEECRIFGRRNIVMYVLE